MDLDRVWSKMYCAEHQREQTHPEIRWAKLLFLRPPHTNGLDHTNSPLRATPGSKMTPLRV